MGLRLDRLGLRPPAAGQTCRQRRHRLPASQDLLQRGYDVAGVRDRDAIAQWFRQARQKSAPPRTQLMSWWCGGLLKDAG